MSLVDKDLMRTSLNKIFERVKIFNKANAAAKLNSAYTLVSGIGNNMTQNSQVVLIPL